MSNWNGEVRCIQSSSISFTEGKVYKITNGYLKDNQGFIYGEYYNINKLNETLASQFEEICRKNSLNGIIDQINTLSDSLQKISVQISTFLEGKTPIKLPFYQFDEDEIITLKALWLNGYEYIVRDDDDLWAYDGMPKEDDGVYDNETEWDYAVKLNSDLFQQVHGDIILDISFELSKVN